MKLILFIDTETTGFLNFKAPMNHSSQPHLVQFAALVCDENGEVLGQHVSLVCPPDGVEIPEQATAVHGITTEQARSYGMSPLAALQLLDELVMPATLIVAHNIDFDCGVIGCMYARDKRVLNMYGGGPATPEHFCTMRATTPLCKLPGRYDDYKWPKLIEAYQHLFGCGFDDAHDALADVTACKRIYFELLARENQPSTTGAES